MVLHFCTLHFMCLQKFTWPESSSCVLKWFSCDLKHKRKGWFCGHPSCSTLRSLLYRGPQLEKCTSSSIIRCRVQVWCQLFYNKMASILTRKKGKLEYNWILELIFWWNRGMWKATWWVYYLIFKIKCILSLIVMGSI